MIRFPKTNVFDQLPLFYSLFPWHLSLHMLGTKLVWKSLILYGKPSTKYKEHIEMHEQSVSDNTGTKIKIYMTSLLFLNSLEEPLKDS